MTLQELMAQKAEKIQKMSGLNEGAKRENRDFNDGERKQWEELDKEVRSLDGQISRANRMAEFERHEAQAETHNPEMVRELRNYSLAKATRESMSGQLSGLEREVHDEFARDREVRGFMAPVELLLGDEQRSQTVGTATKGGELVATQLMPMADRYRPALKVQNMGATIHRGLTGNLELPKMTGSGTAHWVNEDEDTNRSDVTFAKADMSPKTVSGEYQLSRRLMLQNNQVVENILRQDLSFILAQAIDSAAIQGGGAKEPTGILATAGVLEIPGGPLNSDLTADLINALEVDDVSGTTAFLTNPKVMNAARKLKDNDGHTFKLSEIFHDKRVEQSTQVPDNIGDLSDKNALIYGEWSALHVGYWSAVDILANPYHADVASKGGLLLHAFLDTDIVVRHDEAFRYTEID
jgi:HK97 family phage major capsid protein